MHAHGFSAASWSYVIARLTRSAAVVGDHPAVGQGCLGLPRMRPHAAPQRVMPGCGVGCIELNPPSVCDQLLDVVTLKADAAMLPSQANTVAPDQHQARCPCWPARSSSRS